MTRPFEGIRIIDITHVLAGPFAAYQLAVLGADVIKVDDPNDPDQSRSSGTDKALNDRQMGTGFLTQGSLIWNASGLTTVKFFTDTQIAETTVAGSSGVLVRTYSAEVDHDFRRWLTAVGKFTYGTLDYQGQNRNDKTYSLEGNLIYKLNRNIWIKGTLRHDILDSNVPLSSSQGTVVMLGVRLQN